MGSRSPPLSVLSYFCFALAVGIRRRGIFIQGGLHLPHTTHKQHLLHSLLDDRVLSRRASRTLAETGRPEQVRRVHTPTVHAHGRASYIQIYPWVEQAVFKVVAYIERMGSPALLPSETKIRRDSELQPHTPASSSLIIDNFEIKYPPFALIWVRQYRSSLN